MKKMWEGRFSEASSELLERFNASIMFDRELYSDDIAGSIAHSAMLSEAGIISVDEAKTIKAGLEQILGEIESNEFEWDIADEDIHMAIEKRLSQIIGKEIGGKLHTARSRNDQVAVDFRHYVMRKNREISFEILNFIRTLLEISKLHLDTLMPGYTHLQHAQPVTLAFHLNAYISMFKRDYERFISSFERGNFSPLGSAALAGTPHHINRHKTASELGFYAPIENAMDGVSDRDFALEILFNISVFFMHASRLCEELVLWSSSEFGFVTISDAYSTGSSIMPQKKNPDVAELIRGKTGRTYGNLIGLLTVMKALPLAYNKDMQEDKEGVFDSVKAMLDSIKILNEMMKTAKFNKDKMLNMVSLGHLSATDLADFLVREKGVPFREAHLITGKCVAQAEALGKDLSQMSAEELRAVDERVSADALACLSLRASKDARRSYGGTSNSCVLVQIASVQKWLESVI